MARRAGLPAYLLDGGREVDVGVGIAVQHIDGLRVFGQYLLAVLVNLLLARLPGPIVVLRRVVPPDAGLVALVVRADGHEAAASAAPARLIASVVLPASPFWERIEMVFMACLMLWSIT